MRNLELKARLHDLNAARQIARQIANKDLGVQEQVDTYFCCSHGRLKLRQVGHAPSHLIWYRRADEEGPRASHYRLVPISNPETLKGALASALGVWCVVEKHREVYLWRNVRIHLDRVARLGSFLEFEAVLGGNVDEAMGHRQLAELTERFSIATADLVAGSYSDLLEHA